MVDYSFYCEIISSSDAQPNNLLVQNIKYVYELLPIAAQYPTILKRYFALNQYESEYQTRFKALCTLRYLQIPFYNSVKTCSETLQASQLGDTLLRYPASKKSHSHRPRWLPYHNK